MLQRLYDILFEFREYVLVTCLVILSIILMAMNDNPQVRRIRSAATVVFGIVQDRFGIIPRYIGLRAENDLLRRTNIELADEVQRLREAKLENLRIRQLIGLKNDIPYPLIAAHVINKNLNLLRNTITLDVGTADSVQLQMPVVGDGGLVGMVTAVTEHYAVVNILLNTDFRASARDQRSRVDGIVACDGKTLAFKNVPKTRDVAVGDVVTTSEYSSTFPPEIRIGLVSTSSEQSNVLFKTIVLQPGVDFVKLEEVFVVHYVASKERTELELKSSAPRPVK